MEWKAKLLSTEYDKLAYLIEGDELHFHHNTTKGALSFFMSIIYGSNDAVSLKNEIDLDLILEDSNAKIGLEQSIQQLHEAMNSLTNKISNKLNDILLKHDNQSGMDFVMSFADIVEDILRDYIVYVLKNDKTAKKSLSENCFKLTNKNMLSNLETLAQTFAAEHLKITHFSDEGFNTLDSFFSKIIAQIALIYPQYFVKNVVETFVEINQNRENDYWNHTIVTQILENHLNSENSYKEIAKNIAKEFEENYESINKKNNHQYSVIVYNDIQGFDDHSVSGNDFRIKFHYKGKNVVIFRGKFRHAPYCEALETIDYVMLSGCSKDLSVTSDKVLERCTNINNALIMTVGANPETYPDNEDGKILGHKEIYMKSCILIKNRVLFYSYY
uniref:Uncharacterized protein n=1 Tax=Panagrolaimus sp. PS1159 TaxID=55785 RepID=A0AC35FQ48_9BILA